MIRDDPRLERIKALEESYSALQSELPLLDERIGLLREIVATATSGHGEESTPALCRFHRDLGFALYTRYHHVRDVHNLHKAQDSLICALQYPADGLNDSFPSASSLLGSVIRERIRELEKNEEEGLQEALKLHRHPFVLETDTSDWEKAYHARELGLTLRIYYRLVDPDPLYLHESVDQLRDACQRFSHAGCEDLHSMLGLCLSLHSLCLAGSSAQEDYLEEAFLLSKRAATICNADARDFYTTQCTRAHIVIYKSWVKNDAEFMDEAIAGIRGALRDAPLGWAQLLTSAMSQGLLLSFQLSGSEDDISESISVLTRQLARMDQSHETWHYMQHILSQAFCARFSVTGAPEDIDGAIRTINLALLTDGTGRAHVDRLAALSEFRKEQYIAFGDIAHLDECIALSLQGIQIAPSESIYFRELLGFLLEALRLRYEQLKKRTDLDQALQLIDEYLPLLEGEDPEISFRLTLTGSIILLRFQLTGTASDLDWATSLHRRAVHAMGDMPKHHQRFLTYAKTLRTRFEVLGEHESKAESLQMHHKVYSTLSKVHPDRAYACCGLARLYLCSPRDRNDVVTALEYLHKAVNNDYCSAYRRVQDVLDVLTYAKMHNTVQVYFHHEEHVTLLMVYSATIDLLPQVASFGLGPQTRLQVVVAAGQLIAQGTAQAISLGRLRHAVEILEAGRGIFWSQGLQLRTQFSGLPEPIAKKLTTITRALGRPLLDTLTGPDRDRELGRRRQLGEDFRTALAEARLLPGFENLLRNADFKSLARVGEHRPVAIFVTDEKAAYAIIVLFFADPQLVKLPNVSNETLKVLLKHLDAQTESIASPRGMRKGLLVKELAVDVYRELWANVMRPVISRLGWPRAQGRKRPRLTLCPTGIFMQLPLHAAGIHTGDDRVACSDYFVASYTPSMSALLNAQKTLKPIRCSDVNTLLVAVDSPFEGSTLPTTNTEADRVQSLVPSDVVHASSCADVLEHFRSASIVHFACHGSQHPTNPLQSGFFLDDGLLTVSNLMELELPNAFLAVLSACETAKGDATQPDQAIHLAATMLFTGFKSVVATMWYMGDLDGPIVAESIYSSLFSQDNGSDFLDPNIVPYALDEAVQKLRDSGTDPSFWATYIHIGV